MIKVIAYQPVNGTPLEDYQDFPIGMEFSIDEIDQLTDMGHLPPGIVLRGELAGKMSQPCVVKGHYNEVQRVEVL
jgi:hypothetical protein